MTIDFPEGGSSFSRKRYVKSEAAKAAVRGHEAEIVQALGIPWPPGRGDHINCPHPDHDDRDPSWRLMESGLAVCTCHDGRPHSVFDVAMHFQGLDFEAAKLRIVELLGRTDLIIGPQTEAPGLTLEEYAQAKKLPIEFLLGLGVRQATYGGRPAVRMPYTPADGGPPSIKFRISLSGDPKTKWRKGDKALLYGAHDAKHLPAAGRVVLVEGESDCHTLWKHQIPALGLPGAAAWNEERDAPLLKDVPVIFVVVEPDRGGAAVMAWLMCSSIASWARLVHMPRETKDVSALYLSDPENFVKNLDALFEAAQPLPQHLISSPPPRPDEKADDRPSLIVDDADLTRTARALRDLLATRADLYDRGTPVRLVRDVVSDAMFARQLTVEGVVHEAHRVARPVKLKVNKDGSIVETPVTLPNRVARLYLDMMSEWNLRVLNGVTTAPILSGDGTIVGRHGYDQGLGLWCDGVETAPMPPMVPMSSATAALLRLRITFRTFPFADAPRVQDATLGVEVVDISQPPGHDESAFLMGLMTAVCRPSLWLAPGLLLVAPQISGAGTGKGLLVRAICIIAFGQSPRPFTVGHDREELEKRITAALLEAAPVLFLDNANSLALRSPTLASAMTERPAHARLW